MTRLLVVGDSLAFHGPLGPLPADDSRLWPNIAAAQLGTGRAELIAGFGWTARDAWWAVTGDPRFWAALPRVDVLVLAVGGMDTLPSPLPTYLRQGLRYLRPDGLRRQARTAYLGLQPLLATVLRGRPVALPPRLTGRYLDDCVRAVRAIRPGLPVVGMLPPVHRSPAY
ncbi:MAG: SGNH/GDSL hydrolase family protein, partial [Kutzneria sp.]|nr:SGNH/GDSL hydrolase family protein [Kutzneria sp.]